MGILAKAGALGLDRGRCGTTFSSGRNHFDTIDVRLSRVLRACDMLDACPICDIRKRTDRLALMILLLDNYDSFTYNLVQRLGEIDGQLDLRVFRNDRITVDEIVRLAPSHLIISPGPCTPNEAGISLECVERLAGKLPILGVCLGHQTIGQATGGHIVRAQKLMHGKTDHIHHNGQGLFTGLPNPFVATRYHSLVVQPETISDQLIVTAWCDAPDGGREVMGICHRDYPLIGLQFHPESFLTVHGTQLLEQFIQIQWPK